MKKNSLIFYFLCGVFFLIGIFFDNQILIFLAKHRKENITSLMNWLSFFGTWFMVLILMTSLFLWREKKRKWIFSLWSSVILTFILTYSLKFLIGRERPLYEIGSSFTPSFPSGHSAAVFSTLPILDKEFPRLKWFWLGFSLMVVFSRLYLGSHYLTDVVAGMILGFLTGTIIVKYKIPNKQFIMFKKWLKRKEKLKK